MSTNSSLIVLVYPDLTRYELRRGKIRMEHHLPSPGLSGMKIFYAWQSDLPNNINRGFIRTALEAASEG